MHEKRFYREWTKESDLLNFEVTIFETDLLIFADRLLENEAKEAAYVLRKIILDYIEINDSFKESLEPIGFDSKAPDIIKDMLEKSVIAGVGPMAGVAGAIAEYVGGELLKNCGEIIIENGGDIFLKSNKVRRLGIYAGNSPLSGKISLKIKPSSRPVGICTSSGTVGHSKSFGIADAVTIVSDSTVLADCVATGACNLVKDINDLQKSVKYAKSIDGVKGIIVIAGDRLATWGEIELE